MTAASMVIAGGAVVAPDGVVDAGYVSIENGRIVAVSSGRPPGEPAEMVDAAGGWIVPGFIDVQINGGGGVDVTTSPERIDVLGRMLPRSGVTAFVPTVITSSAERRSTALAAWPPRHDGAAAVALGLHLEGPMLSPLRAGAHPVELLVSPSPDLLDGWSAANGVVLTTIAPELAGAIDAVEILVGRGVVVSIGHTDCSATQFAAAVNAGATYVTHLFNAMRPFSHRDPGPVGATLADERVIAGIICDGLHVDPIAVRMAWRALGSARLNLVTDAVAALGAPPGSEMVLGDVAVTVGADGVRTADGVLAGSSLTLDQALRNLVSFTGCGVPDAVATMTSTPARLLGHADRGRLATGARGDVTVLDSDLRVIATVVGGEVAWRS